MYYDKVYSSKPVLLQVSVSWSEADLKREWKASYKSSTSADKARGCLLQLVDCMGFGVSTHNFYSDMAY